jgi:hypothetical protein
MWQEIMDCTVKKGENTGMCWNYKRRRGKADYVNIMY